MTRAGFRPAACAAAAAYRWYEEQRPGLGDEFVAAVDAAVASIVAFPEGYPVVHRGARRVLLERFTYGLFYRLAGQRVIKVACMHAARDPKAWRSRLDANTRVNPRVRPLTAVLVGGEASGRPAGYAQRCRSSFDWQRARGAGMLAR